MINKFIESKRLFEFLAKEQYYLSRELGLSEFKQAKIARRMQVPAKMLMDRTSGRTTHYPASLTSDFATQLGAQTTLLLGTGSEYDYTDDSCRLAYLELDEVRHDKVRTGQKEFRMALIAKEMNISMSYAIQLKHRRKYITIDELVAYAEALDVIACVQVVHSFRHVAE
jgi:hypothetical protein